MVPKKKRCNENRTSYSYTEASLISIKTKISLIKEFQRRFWWRKKASCGYSQKNLNQLVSEAHRSSQKLTDDLLFWVIEGRAQVSTLFEICKISHCQVLLHLWYLKDDGFYSTMKNFFFAYWVFRVSIIFYDQYSILFSFNKLLNQAKLS